jgi:hypothetical protein
MPSRENVREAVAAMKRTADYEFFFSELKSPNWIEPLREEGLFANPWPPIREGEFISFPSWPQAGYLRRMASDAPEAVRDIIRALPDTDNTRIHEDLADAAFEMPASIAASLVPTVAKWLAVPYQRLLPDKAGQLFARLSRENQVDAALGLATGVLAILPDPRASDSNLDPSVSLLEARARFEHFQYEMILQRHLPDLVDAGGVRALRLLCDLLQRAVELSGPRGEKGEDYSYMWVESLDHVDVAHDDDLRPLLARHIRDSAIRIVSAHPQQLTAVIKELESRPWKIFRRIALSVLVANATESPDLVRDRLLSVESSQDPGIFHEFWTLAQRAFSSLTEDAREVFLTNLQTAFDDDQKEAEAELNPEAIYRLKRSVRHALYRRLTLIGSGLPPNWQAKLRELREEFGELVDPEYLVRRSAVWVGPTSPMTEQDVASMSLPALIVFLREWKPSGDWMADSTDGLGRILSAAVTASPERYAAGAEGFREVDPTYIHWLIFGLNEARRVKRRFPWEEVLSLCQWVVNRPAEPLRGDLPNDDRRDWKESRRAIADLLATGFEPDEGAIPFGLRELSWAVLLPLTGDPDPTPENEARFGGNNMDPMTLSVNSTRGRAMHAVIQYALWVRRTLDASAEAQPVEQSFATMPEVVAVLESHLDPDTEPSVAIRAVFGRWLPWLVLLDVKWTKGAIGRIFPADRQLSVLRSAAWDSYLLYSGVFDNVLDLLVSEYSTAIDRIEEAAASARTSEESNRRLAEHVVVFYLRGRLSLEEPQGLLLRFYGRAPAKLRKHALGLVGRTLQGDEKLDPPPEVRERMKRLWAWRLEQARGLPREDQITELPQFGWWFTSGRFPDAWALPELLKELHLTRKVEMTHRVVEKLAELAVSEPQSAIEALSLIVQGTPRPWDFALWSKHAEDILSAALKSSNVAAIEEARKLIDLFVAKGNRAYVHLVEGSGPA